MPRPRGAGVLVALASVMACGDDSTGPTAAARVAQLALADPLPDYAYVGRTLVPSVRLLDAHNRPVAGVRVTFASARGTTTLASASAVSDASGIARAGAWTLPTRPTLDTLVVAVDGARGLAPLRVHLGVRAGPIARWVTLAPATGEGTVRQSFLTGSAFQAFDPYDNPVGLAAARVETAPGDGGERVPRRVDADATGTFTLAEWVPRVLGTYTMRLVPLDGEGVPSPTLTRIAPGPACAPTTFVPAVGRFLPGLVLSGVLGDDAACPAAEDRVAIGADSTRFLSFGVRASDGSRSLPFRIVRAGTSDDAGILLPDTSGFVAGRGVVDIVLPRGEYELVVSSGGAAGRIPFEIVWEDLAGLAATFRTMYVVKGGGVRAFAISDVETPEAGVPRASGRLMIVPMRDAAERRLKVTATGNGWEPTIAVYGRRDGSLEREFIGVAAAAGSLRTLVVDVPAGFDEALVYVMSPKPVPSSYIGDVRVLIE